jgi:hypothetical protein
MIERLWEPDLSFIRDPVHFSKKKCMYKFEPVLITSSHSCENLRLVFSPVFTCKSVNWFSSLALGWKIESRTSQHLKTAKHWSTPINEWEKPLLCLEFEDVQLAKQLFAKWRQQIMKFKRKKMWAGLLTEHLQKE